jgi:hypothetical protein
MFHFPDGPSRRLTPGMLVTIPAGQLYQLDNTATNIEYMVLLGAPAESGETRASRQMTKSSPSMIRDREPG